MLEPVAQAGEPTRQPRTHRVVAHAQDLDRRAAAADVSGQILPLKELQVLPGVDRLGRHGCSCRSGSVVNDTPQYRCCWPLRPTVTNVPAPLVPVLAAHRRVRGLRAVHVTPLWSSRYRPRASAAASSSFTYAPDER